MSYDVFDVYTPASKARKAHELFDELVKTQDGQLQVLNMAREKIDGLDNNSKVFKELACIYLYDRLKPQIVNLFKRLFVNNTTDHSSDNARVFENGTIEDFASIAYLFINGNTLPSRRSEKEELDPYARVDKEVAEGSEEKDWIVTFQFGLLNCLQTFGRRLIHDENALNSHEVSYDAYDIGTKSGESDVDSADAVSATDDIVGEDETFENMSVNQFLDMLKKDYPDEYQMYTILSEFPEWTWRDIETEFGLNRSKQNRTKKSLQDLTKRYFDI